MKIFNDKKFLMLRIYTNGGDTLGTEGQKAETNGSKTA